MQLAALSHLVKKNIAKLVIVPLILIIAGLGFILFQNDQRTTLLKNQLATLSSRESSLSGQLKSALQELEALKSEDQYQTNKKLEGEIKNIHDTYQKSVSLYEKLLDLRAKNVKTEKIDQSFAASLKLLADKNYSSASATLTTMETMIKEETEKTIAAFKIPENVPVNNVPPSSGYQRQQVNVDGGTFMVSIISADSGSTRVIVDTASDSDCGNDCPVLPLANYISRSGAFAGVNGSYFCPATYPSCAGKTNSYDTLLMNKNKKYFNSDNNVYSNVPAVIFGGGGMRFVSRSLEWGRDTGIDSMIANYPLLLSGGNIVYGGDSDPKHGSKGNRSFVGTLGSKVYIGVVHSSTLSESAKVLQALGLQEALNLDDGGSTALWSGGYKVGPGRNLPNAVLFIRK